MKEPVPILDRKRLQNAVDLVIGHDDETRESIDTDAIVELYVTWTLEAEGKAEAAKPKWWARATAGALVFVGGLFFIGLILRAGVEFFAWGYTVPDTINGWFGF